MAQKKIHVDKTDDNTLQVISICDIMHENANEIIEKMESLLPINMQMYSDFYTEYLHSLQDLYGACYIAENEILSKLGISRETLQSFGDHIKAMTKFAVTNIEMANNIQKTFLQNQTSAVKVSDQYIHLMLDYYSRTLASSLGMFARKY